MTADELAKMIPPEVVEAAAKGMYNDWRVANGIVDDTPEWTDLSEDERSPLLRSARAAIAAALNAWPGAYGNGPKKKWQHYTPALILPLKEAPPA
jgi:hypothetical protein